jgi:hypothetical protein
MPGRRMAGRRGMTHLSWVAMAVAGKTGPEQTSAKVWRLREELRRLEQGKALEGGRSSDQTESHSAELLAALETHWVEYYRNFE